jgi:hypothetical protein
MPKIKVKALQPFSHGNVDAQKDGIYAMNAADARELEKAGFVSLEAAGDAEQTQIDQPRQAKQPGDVVVDDADDLLGDGTKAAQTAENKMEQPARNKATAAKK